MQSWIGWARPKKERVAGLEALTWWSGHLRELGVKAGEVVERDGRLTLDVEDPEGQRLALVDDGGAGEAHPLERSPVPAHYHIRGRRPIIISVPIGRTARFVKLAVTGNHGGKNTSLAEVRILEGTAEGYRSVLSAPEPQLPVTNAIVSEGDAEAEPNSTVDTAGLLFMESPLRGRIKPLGDEDYFTLEIDKPKFPEVSIELRGRPYIRTSLTLHQGDRIIASFDPTNAAGDSAIIKFPVTQSSYGIRVFEPPTSMLVVYDASSSMREGSGTT